jgi:hypothetical protein
VKKADAIYLRKVAKKLPLVFQEEISMEPWSGRDLFLTPYEDDPSLRLKDFGSCDDLDPDKIYLVPIPAFRAVLHDQQLKDAWKKNGKQGVEDYVLKVIRSVLGKGVGSGSPAIVADRKRYDYEQQMRF